MSDLFSEIETHSLKSAVAHYLQNLGLFSNTDPDPYTLYAAQTNHIGYMDVTPDQRRAAKWQILRFVYGLGDYDIERHEYDRQFYAGTSEFGAVVTGRMHVTRPPLQYIDRYPKIK